MYIIRLAYLQLKERPAGSLLSLVLFAIGVAIISFLLIVRQQLDEQVSRNLAGIDLVVGAKGSPLQLILSSVMHMDYPTGNISLAEAQMIGRNPLVEKTIPLALGDNHMGYRIVGTTPDYAGLYRAELQQGSWYDRVMEAVVGSAVARATGLSIGDQFSGVHGFMTAGHAHDDHEYTVTGVMKPTGTVIDKLILTPVESVWLVHEAHDHDHAHDDGGHDHDNSGHSHDHQHDDGGNDHDDKEPYHEHDHRGHDHQHEDLPDEHDHDNDLQDNEQMKEIRRRLEAGDDISAEEMELIMKSGAIELQLPADDTGGREITALMVIYRSPAAAIQLPRQVNETTNMQAASPAFEVERLFSMLGYGFDTLAWLAWIIIAISAIHLFVQLVNTLKQGMLQHALMRVMGAGRAKVFLLIMAQGVMLAAAGWLTGIVLARIAWMILPAARMLPAGLLPPFLPEEALLLLFSLTAGVLASLIPAARAYFTDIHHTLRNNATA